MKKSVMIVGGSGVLGRSVLAKLLPSFHTINVDFNSNPQADLDITLNTQSSALERVQTVKEVLKKEEQTSLAAVLSLAGGWQGEDINSPRLFESTREMMDMNLLSALMAGHLAHCYLSQNGLLVLTGAAQIYNSKNPFMLTYSMSKTAVHGLASDLAQETKLSDRGIDVVTILPTVIDTPMNREGMPDADHNTWLPPDKIGDLLNMWVSTENRPTNGSFVELNYEKGAIATVIKNK